MRTHFSPRQRLWLALILLAALALRLYRLGADSLWYDETVSALLAAKPLAVMWAHTAGDIHPPLYYALLHVWSALSGDSEFALAFLSLWFGVAAIPLAAQVGARVYNPTVGVLAALLAALNPFWVWYSQEVRMYTLGVFVLLGLLLLVLAFLRASKRWPWLILGLYAGLTAVSLWTLYYAAFALVALNLFVILWLIGRERGKLAGWLLAQAAALLLYLPWLPIALRQATDPPVPPWRAALPLADLLRRVLMEGGTALAFGQSVEPARWWWLGALAMALALLAFALPARLGRGRRGRAGTALLWTTVLAPVALIVLVSQTISPLYHVRYVVLYSGAFPVLLAAGAIYLASRGPLLRLLASSLLVLLLIGSAASLRAYFTDRFAFEAADDLRGAVMAIDARLGPRDAVLINAGYLYPAFVHYWPDEIGWLGRLSAYPPSPEQMADGPPVVLTGHVDGDPTIGWGDPASDFYTISGAETAARLERLFADADTVWVLRGYDTVNDPDGLIRSWLEAHGELISDEVLRGQTFVRVQGWRAASKPSFEVPAMGHALPVDFDGGIRLLGFDAAPAAPGAGHALRLLLRWQRSGPIDRRWKVFNQVVDAEGRVVAQADGFPRMGGYPTDVWATGEVVSSNFVLPLPVDLPPGEYRLITGFYDAATGERLPLAGGGDSVTLIEFAISD